MRLARAIAIAIGRANAEGSLERSHERTNGRTNEEGGRLDLDMTLSYARVKSGT
jgi:hypothetical protein